MIGKIAVVLMLCLVAFSGMVCYGAEETQEGEEVKSGSDLRMGIVAIAAALSVGLCAIATGIAQSRIGAAGCGTIAERPDSAGTVIMLVAIPETMVILGFVVAVLLIFGL